MNNYFQHLLDRSTERTPGIRPRLPSVYESPASTAWILPIDFETQAEPLRHNLPSEDGSIKEYSPAESPESKQAIGRVKAIVPEDLSGQTGPTRETPLNDPVNRRMENISKAPVLPSVRHHQKTIVKPADEEMPEIFTASADISPSVAPETFINQKRQQVAGLSDHQQADHQTGVAKVHSISSPDDRQQTQALQLHPALRDAEAPMELSSTKQEAPARVFPATTSRNSAIRPFVKISATPATAPASALPFVTEQVAPERTIKVTIGRIDVRAIMPQPPPATTQTHSKAVEPKITLEDYLKKQRGGS